MFFVVRLSFVVIMAMPVMVLAQQKFSPKDESLKLFNKYKPVIEKRHEAIVDPSGPVSGDINGDGKEDCIISFIMYPQDGGNLHIGSGSAIYLNTGTGMKVVGAFPEFKFCYYLDHIRDQIIFGKEYECAPPYNKFIQTRKFKYVNGKIMEIH
ncbi:hypothetical protein A4D02_09815 [Niastella koreensis]|nr:hypothetical protein A4D02_09815 [Niastella koreensis]